MPRDFNTWLATMKNSIASYDYYIDFNKIYQNIETIKIELNMLNSLIGSQNIEQEFISLVTQYPNVLKCIPLLLAVRNNEIYATDGEGEFLYQFQKANYSLEQYCIFMQKTGLFDLISKHLINNLVDYATGIETGLDSNGRKNRGGHLMENLVENYLQRAGFQKNISYYKELTIKKITENWNIDLSAISNQGKTVKRFDFVVKTADNLYAIETNFYASNGSKLNETARSYKNIALEAKSIPNFTFIWITDGKGWETARHNLEETFDILPTLYNISDLENNIFSTLFI
ncbi:type II restriction endonuclease [uncultured Brachyspira sp.]|uniref:type II restriction endonuclease n=1 Tax=uncultured Brachyspira sp. TaxID=221953 RepID=UPI00262EFBE1|nr:type II restriction endonuclease [uncultured Brachyspira sp.]